MPQDCTLWEAGMVAIEYSPHIWGPLYYCTHASEVIFREDSSTIKHLHASNSIPQNSRNIARHYHARGGTDS